jgi:pyruvate kinase
VELIATLGPSASTEDAVRELIAAGADRLRLNASFLDAFGLRALARVAFGAGVEAERIVVDLQGGKTRLGTIGEPREVRRGEQVELPVDRQAFLRALEPEDELRVDDGRLSLQVLGVDVEAGRLRARVLTEGRIEGRKGLALAKRRLPPADDLLPRDVELLGVALALGVSHVAVSYATALLLERVREAAAERGVREVTLHAKVEQPGAVDALAMLAAAADTLWLCRGDLGAEVGLERLPRLQRRVLDEAPLDTPLYVAGQVLHHLTVSPRPTRAEACQVAELVWRGVGGFVLSDETARGPHGPAAVTWLKRLVEAAREG